jgi:hypothetical protein
MPTLSKPARVQVTGTRIRRTRSLAQDLRDHAVEEHGQSCGMHRLICSCGHDDKTDQLLRRAAARIDELEKGYR